MNTEFYPGFDGARLALHRMGAGRPLVMLHGLFSSAEMNWVKWGQAELLAAAGFECLMPDLRAHGHSEAPHDPAAYPDDVLAKDLAETSRPYADYLRVLKALSEVSTFWAEHAGWYSENTRAKLEQYERRFGKAEAQLTVVQIDEALRAPEPIDLDRSINGLLARYQP